MSLANLHNIMQDALIDAIQQREEETELASFNFRIRGGTKRAVEQILGAVGLEPAAFFRSVCERLVREYHPSYTRPAPNHEETPDSSPKSP